MDVIEKLHSLAWCKERWNFPSIDDNAKKLLQECVDVAAPEMCENIHDVIRRSKNFPIPFPIDTVRLEKLKLYRPVEKLNENIKSTYPVIHERLLILMANFLTSKREYGSSIEKKLYRKMSILDLIDRILKKRAVVFMKKQDVYKLLNGKKGEGGWESVGTEGERPPLVLADCLSYDEMKLSALLAVSGPTACLNDGARTNRGAVRTDGVEPDAIIIASLSFRAARRYPEVTAAAPVVRGASARDWRSLSPRWVRRPRGGLLDAAAYHRRLAVMAELVLLEAEARAAAAGKHAFVNVIGAGLGVWKILPHQLDLYILSFLDTIHSLLNEGAINNVSDVNFAYIKPANSVLQFFNKQTNSDHEPSRRQLFLDCESHSRGGVNVQLQEREPAARLAAEHGGKLLVLTYPWDSNAHPGNEFWLGKLSSSGDGAAASFSQVAELHNAHINEAAVSGGNTRVAGRRGLRHISVYCSSLV